MFSKLKSVLYFPIASYFKFFAKIRLQRWNPRIIVVTGSNGKTTLLNLLESQIGDKAKYSHYANSSFGIPFDILDLHRKTLLKSEWIGLFLRAPLQIFAHVPSEKIYIVEADADRPAEGKFLAELLRPEVVLWVSTSRTHSMNFDRLVSEGKFATVEEAIAYEYGYFLEYAKKLVIIDGDSSLELNQTKRSNAEVIIIKKADALKNYTVDKKGTRFQINGADYSFAALLPEEFFYSILMCKTAVEYLNLPFDNKFTHFVIPQGRGSILEGVKGTMLIDSTYNANLSSITAMAKMFDKIPHDKKWAVIGDMMELGDEEQEEHEKLAAILRKLHLKRIILIGKRVTKYTLPALKDEKNTVAFNESKDALSYFNENLTGGEAILFKGSQSLLMEGIIEPLLQKKDDRIKLPRQTPFWKMQRQKAGL